MRAGRLVSLMLILQRRGRSTAAYLAEQLEVSQRTIKRDIEELSGAGVPVYAVRGPGGGFELLEGFDRSLPDPAEWASTSERRRSVRRGKIRISPEGRQLAAVLGVLQPLRVDRSTTADQDGWIVASFRIPSIDATVTELLSLSPHLEVLGPPVLRRQVADRICTAAGLYSCVQ